MSAAGTIAVAAVLLLAFQYFQGAKATPTTAPLGPGQTGAPAAKQIRLEIFKRDGAIPGSPTSPADEAQVVFWPLDPATGYPHFDKVERKSGKSPIAAALVPGDYLVVVVLRNHGFHEVYRHIPGDAEGLPGAYKHQFSTRDRDGNVILPEVEVPSTSVEEGMVLFPASERFVMGSDRLNNSPRHERRVASFLIDPTEATIGEFGLHWTLPQSLRDKPELAAHAVHSVHWDIATAYAEKIGKRLPDETEFEAAATNYGRETFPWGGDVTKISDWTLGPVSTPIFDETISPPMVFGLYSNVAEWTSSWATFYPPDRKRGAVNASSKFERVVRGAPPSVIDGNGLSPTEPLDPRDRRMLRTPESRAGLGFRCARSCSPRLKPEDFCREITPDQDDR